MRPGSAPGPPAVEPGLASHNASRRRDTDTSTGGRFIGSGSGSSRYTLEDRRLRSRQKSKLIRILTRTVLHFFGGALQLLRGLGQGCELALGQKGRQRQPGTSGRFTRLPPGDLVEQLNYWLGQVAADPRFYRCHRNLVAAIR